MEAKSTFFNLERSESFLNNRHNLTEILIKSYGGGNWPWATIIYVVVIIEGLKAGFNLSSDSFFD